MLKIGEFSKLSQVSVRMLRHYDKLRLIRPAVVDNDSNYWYYAPEQLSELNRLLALRDLGLSLEEIRLFLMGSLSRDERIEMLAQQKFQLQQQLEEGTNRLHRLLAYMDAIDQEDSGLLPYSIVVKSVPPIRVASVRAVLPDYVSNSLLWAEMTSFLKQKEVPVSYPHYYLYHDAEYRETEIDTELAIPIPPGITGTGNITIAALAGLEHAVTTIHRGDINVVYKAYVALGAWMSTNGYRVCGPNRLAVLRRADANQGQVTEVLWPVCSRSSAG